MLPVDIVLLFLWTVLLFLCTYVMRGKNKLAGVRTKRCLGVAGLSLVLPSLPPLASEDAMSKS